jgi:hypothetical protein
LYSPAIDEWYDYGCDELLQASSTEEWKGRESPLVYPDADDDFYGCAIPSVAMEDETFHEEKVKMCSVSE